MQLLMQPPDWLNEACKISKNSKKSDYLFLEDSYTSTGFDLVLPPGIF